MTATLRAFYRVEHKDFRTGPYSTLSKTGYGFVAETLEDETGVNINSINHPGPHRDGLTSVRDLHCLYFGFATLKQLREWFVMNKKVINFLRSENFVVRRYLVEERFDGGKQSVARTADCKVFTLPFEIFS